MTRKQLSTMSIWLGLVAMLMIHVGPLFSAILLSPSAPAALVGEQQHNHEAHEHSSSAHGHHQRGIAGEPAWLAALELCGYCELLTVNPPLTLSVDLVLPDHEPGYFQPLPQQPLSTPLRRSSGHPRAPPTFHS